MKLFKEGSVGFYAHEGEITKKLPVFYNPVMQFDRDLTVSALRAFGGKSYCDALSASGIRGLRAAKDAGFKEITLNDWNPKAVEVIKKNLAANRIKGNVFNEDANLFLRRFKEEFDAVDIDPFGPFMPYLESAIGAVRGYGGLLCLTATDTAPLCGVSINTCQRRYDARPIRTSHGKEMGLRILIGACARKAAAEDKAVKPLLCYNHKHYFRLFLRIDSGAGKADKGLRNMAYLQHCEKCDWRSYATIGEFAGSCPNCGSKLLWGGPLWCGEFADVDFLKKIKIESKAHLKLIDQLKQEQAIATPFYDLHHLFELKKAETRKTRDIILSIEAEGKKACLTHFCDTGIRSEVLPPI